MQLVATQFYYFNESTARMLKFVAATWLDIHRRQPGRQARVPE